MQNEKWHVRSVRLMPPLLLPDQLGTLCLIKRSVVLLASLKCGAYINEVRVMPSWCGCLLGILERKKNISTWNKCMKDGLGEV